jgi:hypothetical protein
MIIKAAIRKDGIIYIGKRHYNILGTVLPFGYLRDGNQGFVTDTGEFVDRIEAARIAIECGQIKELKWPPNLYSEDLY